MTRIIGALFVSLCLTACGTGQVEPDSAPLRERLLEQEPDYEEQDMQTLAEEKTMLKIMVGDYELTATFEDNSSAVEFRDLLAQGPITVEMEDYGGFEKVGPLGTTLTKNDTRIIAEPGDVILYQGNQITIYYGTNAWNFTRLARIDDPAGLQEKLGDGAITATFSL